MASKIVSRSGAVNFDVNPSPETMYHLPVSPSEPGKFDFYRVHLANQTHPSDSVFSDSADVPMLSTAAVPSILGKRRWTPFADLVCDQSKSSIMNSSVSSKSQSVATNDSSVSSNTNGTQNQSALSLTDAVKTALNKGELGATKSRIRQATSGTTLSSKDLNHLSPQSM